MPSSNSPVTFLLPDLHALTPFKGGFNPNHDRFQYERAERNALYSHLPERKRAFFSAMTGELLTAHSCPYATFERLRVLRDFIDLLYVFDLTTDDESGEAAWSSTHTWSHSFADERYDDGTRLCKLIKRFTAQLRKACHPVAPNHYRRFVEQCRLYAEATAREAEYRERGIVLDLEAYQESRRHASGVLPCLTLAGIAHLTELPDEVVDHSAFYTMLIATTDMVWWANDLYSYNMEQAMGHSAHNVLTVLMKAKGLDLQGACDYVGAHYAGLIRTYLDAKRRLPSWGARADRQIAQHAMGMEAWAVGNINWSFQTARYFGHAHDDVRRTRIVELYPPRT
ncbi:terpenoid synthase [Epithele typhae]|uniref:terpenoid synthase n=1 Tax=Epithele typhae TaxID=378194 RepID=UPI0020084AF7|nr:terpenoid synthase [Epithele typhae]KAH9929557.1 terpenoid synthase [Epithele typhae]